MWHKQHTRAALSAVSVDGKRPVQGRARHNRGRTPQWMRESDRQWVKGRVAEASSAISAMYRLGVGLQGSCRRYFASSLRPFAAMARAAATVRGTGSPHAAAVSAKRVGLP